MDEQKSQTIQEEAGLPDNWVPFDAPPLIPSMGAAPVADGSSRVLQGSLPPGYQHDTSFTGTAYKSDRTPQLSLMPLGVQGNPSSNAGIQSTATSVATQLISQIPAPAPAVAAVGDGLVHGDPVWEHDSAYVELRDEFINSGTNPASPTAEIGQLGWTLTQGATGFTSNAFQTGEGPLHIGEFTWANTTTSNSTPTSGTGTLTLNTVGSGGIGPQTTAWALLENPGWKMTFIWKFHRSTDPIPGVGAGTAINFLKKSMYVGLAANVQLPQTAGWSRPPIFIGARYDTDTTAPAISDSTIKLEAVTNTFPNSSTPTRNNTAGTVFDTGVTPTENSYYRLDIVCTAAGIVTLSLNGSTPQTFTIPKYTASNSGIAAASDNVVAVNNEAVLKFGTVGGVLVNHPFSTGSQVVVSGFITGNAALNGSFTLSQNAPGVSATNPNSLAYLLVASIGANSPGGWQVVGYPALLPIVLWGNDTQAAPATDTRMCVDYFSFVWNKGLAGSTNPTATKPRYW